MTNQTISQLSPAPAAARDDLLLVDVRGADEREEARAPQAIHIPLGEVESRLADLPRERTIAFICQSGHRSAAAAATARAAGRPARSVHGGMTAWRLAELPIERTPA